MNSFFSLDIWFVLKLSHWSRLMVLKWPRAPDIWIICTIKIGRKLKTMNIICMTFEGKWKLLVNQSETIHRSFILFFVVVVVLSGCCSYSFLSFLLSYPFLLLINWVSYSILLSSHLSHFKNGFWSQYDMSSTEHWQ